MNLGATFVALPMTLKIVELVKCKLLAGMLNSVDLLHKSPGLLGLVSRCGICKFPVEGWFAD